MLLHCSFYHKLILSYQKMLQPAGKQTRISWYLNPSGPAFLSQTFNSPQVLAIPLCVFIIVVAIVLLTTIWAYSKRWISLFSIPLTLDKIPFIIYLTHCCPVIGWHRVNKTTTRTVYKSSLCRFVVTDCESTTSNSHIEEVLQGGDQRKTKLTTPT